MVNTNRRATLTVYWVRQKPDLATSISGESVVPPGQSVGIGCERMNGAHCTYQNQRLDGDLRQVTVALAAVHRPR